MKAKAEMPKLHSFCGSCNQHVTLDCSPIYCPWCGNTDMRDYNPTTKHTPFLSGECSGCDFIGDDALDRNAEGLELCATCWKDPEKAGKRYRTWEKVNHGR